MNLIQQVRVQSPALPILVVSMAPEARGDTTAAGANWFLAGAGIMEFLPPLRRRNTPAGTEAVG